MKSCIVKLRVSLVPGRVRVPVVKTVCVDDSDTDSEVEFMPEKLAEKIKKRMEKASAPAAGKKRKRTATVDEAPAPKKKKPATTTTTTTTPTTITQPALNRKGRIVDTNNASDAVLIAASLKASDDIYMSDDEPATTTDESSLYKNVVWGPEATNINYPGSTFPKSPQFSQFVPGRWERMPDSTLSDQKSKLVVKLTDKNGRKRIFKNPPPKDWNNQDAITALNKRTVQQIRRNTEVRFREVVKAYIPEERRWILNNLSAGKPQKGWKTFVKDFNTQFEGQTIPGADGPRPKRTHSSLTKEVERFGSDFYCKGKIPTAGSGKNSKSKAK
ncbi:unnamed protein product [Periconia digitata]|uniref:Uncharacterized protein n=1 Tax=Periconia digitata TaxID=1303443 RepID=A0A9W4XJI1_9PLEO|nr:unnamed protein product [Periconia digitata]